MRRKLLRKALVWCCVLLAGFVAGMWYSIETIGNGLNGNPLFYFEDVQYALFIVVVVGLAFLFSSLRFRSEEEEK